VDFTFFPFVGVLFLINTVLSAQKWQLLLRSDGVHIPLSTLTVTYLVGSFYNMFLPSNIGGDSYRIYDIAKKSKQAVRSVASVFADRLSGFLALVILSCIASAVVAERIGNLVFFSTPFIILIILLSFLYALFKQTPFRFLLHITRLDRIEKIRDLTTKFFFSVSNYGADHVLLVQIMVISFAFQLSVIGVVYLLALSLHVSASFIYFVAFVPLITLMEALPISIYGIGIRDAGYVFLFSWAGLSDIQTRSLALLFLGATACYSLIGGILLMGRIISSRTGNPATNQKSIDDGSKKTRE
jgi:uncharacterized protein (TIRG00374 family)